MIGLQRTDIYPTRQLAAAQARLAATTTDTEGIDVVAHGPSSIWTSLRGALESAQHGKCAYCEDYLRPRMTEIDHIRPKKPTLYWWLAYSPENLVGACRSCNNAKASRWKLVPGSFKLIPRQKPWVRPERAMLVDPTIEDPSPHLTYVYAGNKWRIAAITDRGRWTIKALELDRDSFTREANEFLLQAINPLADEVQTAKQTHDIGRLTNALGRLRSIDRQDQRWLQLVRIVIAHVVNGTYQAPVP